MIHLAVEESSFLQGVRRERSNAELPHYFLKKKFYG